MEPEPSGISILRVGEGGGVPGFLEASEDSLVSPAILML